MPNPLWIALHLPQLSLETFSATLQSGPAWAIDESAGPRLPMALADTHHILHADAMARRLGVKPGLKRATALALAPQIMLGQASPERDLQALTAVAHAALAFTPQVVIEPPGAADAAPHTVLLEVQASLRYFGGQAALQQRLLAALAPLGHRLHLVSGATALGAALLARVHPLLDCIDLAATRKALAAAPVWLLGPGREHWEALQGMGLHTIADLQALPRAGLARRFGELVLSELDRALGDRPDPRDPITLAPTFQSRLELFARADTGEQLMHGAGVLLARLIAWLSAQYAFVRRFTLVMHHETRLRGQRPDDAQTLLEIALAEPSRDSAHLIVLLRERLALLQLPAPTLELSLQAADIARKAPPNSELFPTASSEQEGLTRLIERLQARLGRDQVKCLAEVHDHRPECANAWSAADAAPRSRRTRIRALTSPAAALPMSNDTPAPIAARVRPVWLIAPPQALPARAHTPLLDGQALQLLSGPERIESGWWDGALAERDYFIAQLPDGALVWIYHARLPTASTQAWFLHGRFG